MSNNATKERVIPLAGLSAQFHVTTVLRSCRDHLDGDDRPLVFDMAESSGFYPNAVVPVAAIIQQTRALGGRVTIRNAPPKVEDMAIRNPIEATKENLSQYDAPSKTWAYFDPDQASKLTSAYIDALRLKIECGEGVLDALQWCLYEVLDNVNQHSDAPAGYVMLQIHQRSKRIAIGVSDTGIGIHRSLSKSPTHKPKDATDAITLAMQEGVTRNTTTNQGNGLFGLYRIIEQNAGKLVISSGRGMISLEGTRVNRKSDLNTLHPDHHGTFFDIQMPTHEKLDLSQALKYPHINDYLESLEDEYGVHTLLIREQPGGTGSRAAARELRNKIVNTFTAGVRNLTLDFEGLTIVSSSFADEVVGKLYVEMGPLEFPQRIKLTNYNDTISGLLNKAMVARISTPK